MTLNYAAIAQELTDAVRFGPERVKQIIQQHSPDYEKKIEWLDGQLTDKLQIIEQLESALRRILAEPYGCPFCDSGRLRSADKGHADECGFLMAERALGPTEN